MICRKAAVVSSTTPLRIAVTAFLAVMLPCVLCSRADAQKSKSSSSSAPAPRAAAPAAKTTTSSASHSTNGASGGSHTGATDAMHSGSGSASRPAVGTTRTENGGTLTRTASGKEISKSPTGQVTSVKTAEGHEAKFDSHGSVKEVHANGVTVSRGPNGTRRTEVEREDHSRLVAYGHGRGYVQHEYTYGGHRYYSRAYYYHGGYYRGYYHPYYYHGVYLAGYMPVYYYPPVYFGWAYTPWGEPVAYGWGWGGYPWYGYYGAYFAPYPVYPSAAYWLTDYTVGASLAEAYAATEAGDSAHLHTLDPGHLVYASYDTGTATPAMTKEVKDAVADQIKLILALAQKTADPNKAGYAGLDALLADGKPHVFIAS